jgi:lipopolysaccharide transport system ATP-binding protein
MSNIAIKAENLSKAYQLGEFSTGTLSRDIQRRVALMMGKEDPYLKIGQTNDRTVKGTSDMVWSLKDIDFEINQGDAVGIIGRNGAGKSTLLKVLSRVTTPTTGSVKIKGRVASLLEVGTGFHPELTGRENIFLNGAILGMRKHEIKKHFDAIVDFAGVERYIDTPVKRYSSGMYVRLAFAVAAHLESEILVVDEVLAVGDAEFQKKCLGKMNDVSKGEGRTVLFVSHNMGSIKNLCQKGIFLQNGMVKHTGSVDESIQFYLNSDLGEKSFYRKFTPPADLPLVIEEVQLLKNGVPTNITLFDFKDKVGFELTVNCRERVANRGINIHVFDLYDQLMSAFDISVLSNLLENREVGRYKLTVEFPSPSFKAGNYTFNFESAYFGKGSEQYERAAIGIEVDVLSENPRFQSATQNRPGKVYFEPVWSYQQLD